MFKSYTLTDIPFVGDAKIIFKAEAMVDKERSFGSAVSLASGGLNKDNAFGFLMADASVDNVDGIIVRGPNYGSDGKAVAGMTAEVLTEGLVCVKIESGLLAAKFGDKVYMDATGKFTNDSSSNVEVGTIASNILKAQTAEDGALVDAAYINFKVVKGA